MHKIYVLLASFNRCEKTISCLNSVFSSKPSNTQLDVILFDDGSSDGTLRIVKEKYPNVKILNGNGENYWCRSMCQAYAYIENELKNEDYVLCLNDDVKLYQKSIELLLTQAATSSEDKETVVVGTFVNQSGIKTYGGLKRIGKIKFQLIETFNTQADTLNFNGVLIKASIIKKHGFLNPIFEHAMGDIEYGLRLKKGGVHILTSHETIGDCESNDMNYALEKKNIIQRIKICISKKYFPIRSWLFFTKALTGPFWPLYFVYPYIRYTLLYRADGR